MTKKPIWLLALAALVTTNAFSKAIQDESKRVLAITQAIDVNGQSKLKDAAGNTLAATLVLGEYRWSQSTGFDLQGLYTSVNDGLVYPGSSAKVIPILPIINNSGTLTKADVEDRMKAWEAQNAAPYGNKSSGPPAAQGLPDWLTANSIPYAVLGYTQDFQVSSDLGPGKAKIAFDKVLMPRLTPSSADKSLYGKTAISSDNKSYIKILYYPKGADNGVGQSGATQYDSMGGKLKYTVYDLINNGVLKEETIDVNGAFDSPNYSDQRTPDSVMNCMYDARGTDCKPAPTDIRRLMSRFLSSYALVEYYRTPELKSTDNPDGTTTVDGQLTVKKRELEYKGCAVRYINEGTYSYTTIQSGEQWLFYWGGKKYLLNRGTYETPRTDNYRKEVTYYTDKTTPTGGAAKPYNRARADMTLTLADEFITPEYNNNNELIRKSDFQGNVDPLPPIQITGLQSATRYRKTSGQALVEATCTPEGDVLFFFGKTKGTPAKLQYEAWDFKSPATTKTAAFKDAGACAEGQAQINGDLIYFTGATWSNRDSSIGDAKAAGCGTTFVNGMAITGSYTGQGYCPAGFTQDSCDPQICSYKGSCSSTTGGTTNLANGTCDAPMNEYRIISIDPSTSVTNGPATLPSPSPKIGGTARCGAAGGTGGTGGTNNGGGLLPGVLPGGGGLLGGGGVLGTGILGQ